MPANLITALVRLWGPLVLIGIIATDAGRVAVMWPDARVAAGGGHSVPGFGVPTLLIEGLPELIGGG